MDIINKDFDIPFYIFEEMMEYQKNDYLKLEKIKTLLNMAVINKQLSKEQADFLINKYCN